jgi:hypothetical protein
MARTTGPLFSADATGTVGKLVTHSHWKGRTYAKRSSVPTNPNSPLQVSVRALMAFLNEAWNGFAMTQANKDSWNALAARDRTTPLNAYLAHNLQRWNEFKGPVPNPTPPSAPTNPTFTANPTATGGKGIITIAWDTNARNNGWGVAIHAQPGGAFTNTRANFKTMLTLELLTATTKVLRDIAPGTYRVQRARLKQDGTMEVGINSGSPVVT